MSSFSGLRLIGPIGFFAALALTLPVGSQAANSSETANISSSISAVTVYDASWCSACRSLEAKLTERKIPFDTIDVDKNREAYDRARNAAGMGNGIPLTHIVKSTSTWVLGDDANAVERAYRTD